MKVLQVHNFYQQPGGEDQVYLAEFDLLQKYGELVEQYSVHNDSINRKSAFHVALQTIWNTHSYQQIREVISRFRPDVVHCHNTFPIVSPAAYYAAKAERVAVVQTVQNYRLICPAATLLREGRVCEDCVGHLVPYNGVLHSCYRGSRAASATVASLLTAHRVIGTWHKAVQTYVAPTEFLRSKLVEGGLPAQKVVVKPNFLPADPGAGSGAGAYALFVGRLSPEKGLATLLQAWRELREFPLCIAGDGPLKDFVEGEARALNNVSVLGFQERSEIIKLIKAAALLVVPSEWYEGFPMTIIEAMGCGTPVLASDIGSLSEVVESDVNGAKFEPGNTTALAQQVRCLMSKSSKLMELRHNVRQRFTSRYSAETNYLQLRQIYEESIKKRNAIL